MTSALDVVDVIDLKQVALLNMRARENREELRDEFPDEPRQITSDSMLDKMMEDFEIRGPQYQNAVFMLRQAMKQEVSPPYRVFVDTWPEYGAVNFFRDRNCVENDDQSTVVYQDLDKLIDMLLHTNLRHVYGRERDVLIRGIADAHFPEFRARMSRAGFQLFDFSEPYTTVNLYEEKLLAENSDRSTLYKEIKLNPDCPEFTTIRSHFPETPREQLVDYITNFPSCALATRRTDKLVAYGLTTSTGAMDHIHVIPQIYDYELRANIIISLVIYLKAGKWLNKPFAEIQDGDLRIKRFYERIGFKEYSDVSRRALRIRRWRSVLPQPRMLPISKQLVELEKSASNLSS